MADLYQGNLSVATERLLRHVLPTECARQTFKEGTEFWSAEDTLKELGKMYETEEDEPGTKPILPAEINELADQPTAMEALGGMLFYLKSLRLDRDIFTQRNFNVYDPIREGNSLILDGLTLGHMEVLVNNEGGKEGTLLELLENCATPFGQSFFRYRNANWAIC
jgi:DNA mismatch repair protein MSH6